MGGIRYEGEDMSTGALALGGAGQPAQKPGGAAKALRNLALPVAAISVIFVMLVPVPAFVMDMLLALFDGAVDPGVSVGGAAAAGGGLLGLSHAAAAADALSAVA